jgi:hypothetical protein
LIWSSSIELRMLRVDLIYYNKVFNHLTPCNPNDVFIVYSPDARSRSNLPYLETPRTSSPVSFTCNLDQFFVCVGSIYIGCVCLRACGLKLQRWYIHGLVPLFNCCITQIRRRLRSVDRELLIVPRYRLVTVRFRSPGRH